MKTKAPAIEITNLTRRYGKRDAVAGLTLAVPRGRCYGLFGRNGAGKTTTIKCVIDLLRPDEGRVQVFGLSPRRNELAVKRRYAYVPDAIAYYPWMTVRETLAYLACFRDQWDHETERRLTERFALDPSQKANSLSKGQKAQLALIGAICAEPELLILDEPTSGLDPIVRREFIETVIGAYQEADPENRTVFVSTHLIAEFEGLIDEFTIIDQGRSVAAWSADAARQQHRRLIARFEGAAPGLKLSGVLQQRDSDREIECVVARDAALARRQLESARPVEIIEDALTLEEIVIETLK